jgi:hypothetical protein
MNESTITSTSPLASPVGEFCPRQIVFLIPGNPPVQVTATENGGDIDFTVDVQESGKVTADLRALFFHFNEAKVPGLTITGGDGLLTEYRVAVNNVLDLGDGATLAGAAKPFDVGIEWGTAGGKKDDIFQPVHFKLSDAGHDLTLDDFAHLMFGAKLDSVGGPGGTRNGVNKITGIAPAAPDAHDDTFNIFEDGAAGLNSPSKIPHAVSLNVLANDTDGDGDTLKVIDLHDLPAHGTAAIAADGLSILYTPELDWSGSQTLEYCVSDGKGGQDHAFVTINVAPVADDPLVTYTVAPGANANEIVLTVTATQNDADSSEYIDKLVAGATPAGVTVTPGEINPATEDNVVVQQFIVSTAVKQDFNFNLDFTATSKETGNGDTETASASVPIVIEYNENDFSPTFHATDQSIWSQGSAYSFSDDTFIGIDDHFGDSGGSLIGYDFSAGIKAGFQSTLTFTGGDIDANVSYNLNIDTTLNKTTDSLLISTSQILTGGDFHTTGPEGSYKLDFILNYLFHAALTYDIGIDSGDIVSFDVGDDNTFNIIDINSDGLATTIPFPPPFESVSATLAWPHITTDGSASPPPTGEFSSDGASNNFLQLNLDVDQVLSDIFFGGVDPFDLHFDVGIAEGSVELLDLDLDGGLNVLQKFTVQANGFSGILHFENGVDQAFIFGSDLLLQNASAIDAGGDHDGKVEFTFELDPQATLHNETNLGVNVGYSFDLVKISGSYDIGVDSGGIDIGPLYHAGGSLPVADFGIYNETNALNFAPQSILIAA